MAKKVAATSKKIPRTPKLRVRLPTDPNERKIAKLTAEGIKLRRELKEAKSEIVQLKTQVKEGEKKLKKEKKEKKEIQDNINFTIGKECMKHTNSLKHYKAQGRIMAKRFSEVIKHIEKNFGIILGQYESALNVMQSMVTLEGELETHAKIQRVGLVLGEILVSFTNWQSVTRRLDDCGKQMAPVCTTCQSEFVNRRALAMKDSKVRIFSFPEYNPPADMPRCEVCIIRYSEEVPGRVALLLICGHTICQSCAQELTHDSNVQCPFCIKKTHVFNDTVTYLPRNYTVMDMVGHIKEVPKHDLDSGHCLCI